MQPTLLTSPVIPASILLHKFSLIKHSGTVHVEQQPLSRHKYDPFYAVSAVLEPSLYS